jgi:hypothetical protein
MKSTIRNSRRFRIGHWPGLVFLMGLSGCSGMNALYEKEVRAELARFPAAASLRISDTLLSRLPAPVERHFRLCGWAGRNAPFNARVVWNGFRLKRGRDQAWMPLACRQFNSVREPMRIAYMGGRLMRVLPFEGRDKYQGGHGHMLVKAMGLFAVVDETSRKLDESGLVTVLAETMLLPAYALQSYIRWEALDSTRAKAVLSWNGLSVSGIFEFGESGECLRFESHDRWQQGADAAPIPWSAYFRKYQEQAGIRFATETGAIWHEKTGDFEYVAGRIDRIDFDVASP